ncbi:MAG: RND transporter [Burkholderiales bacterium PBB2]|nr:MAG: RND transporter [Burkholderiales bacterium PBB2]
MRNVKVRMSAKNSPVMPALRLALSASALAVLSACSSLAPPAELPQQLAPAATRWHAPQADARAVDAGQPVWQRLNDPLLLQLQAQAESANPSLQQVLARVQQARALSQQAGSAQLPQLNANGLAQRSRPAQPSGSPTQTLSSVSLDSSWEIDLFARVRQQASAAQARLQASELDAQAARLSLAAEVAQAYLNLRGCERLAQIAQADAAATAQLARFAAERLRVGFESAANEALLQAAAANAANLALAQQAECELAVKGLVALTAMEEGALRQALQPGAAQLPAIASLGLAVASVPAEALARRPDLAASQQQVLAAWAERGAAEAARYPQLQLSGSISLANLRIAGGSDEGRGWSFGPSLSLPLFDGGSRKAQAQGALARYDEALAGHRQSVLQAVREVEEGLVRLDAARAREALAERAAAGYRHSLQATERRWRAGLASAAELEDARRLSLGADSALVQLQREGLSAWVALCRATGAGWNGQAAPLDLKKSPGAAA